ncbi:MarR family winged helix-turn-helix transcriptional regulator [Nitratireductor sp. ZSWI3]|uniref:MarR family winged helix-turn-helix transcriptional regulator n=1 Tax=Nitratireductor sp. ZSWI3 TaxID=2966359 RepID=UPI00214F7D08|nr:MarR family winged helix-turn-helix transcriptional regulator [Nitratireductor sp. ZSWI3]MCR4265949.1 MarR family winged helix-turn-helix transcriptional regulator [Nitratireductor sp. ZSWI3]
MPSENRAAEAWRLMFDFLMQSSPQRLESLEKRGLTPNDSRALFTLEEGNDQPIGKLAGEWGCDPSTATWLVDRLERAGLVERVPSSEDRRKKLVRLTPKGVTTKKDLMEEYYRPPAELVVLAKSDLDELIRILGKIGARQDAFENESIR